MTWDLDGVRYAYPAALPIIADLSWTIPPGVSLLLGPNGAGKTTILKLLAGVYMPVRGAVSIEGVTSRSAPYRYRAKVGWLPQDYQWVSRFTVQQQLEYAGWLKGMSRASAQAAYVNALCAVGLEDLAATPVRHLSGGQRRRLGIAEAIVAEARNLVLDEPTVGLDLEQRRSFREVMRSVADHRRVVVSTHQTDDLLYLADYIVVLAKGNIVYQASAPEFHAAATRMYGEANHLAIEEYYTFLIHGNSQVENV